MSISIPASSTLARQQKVLEKSFVDGKERKVAIPDFQSIERPTYTQIYTSIGQYVPAVLFNGSSKYTFQFMQGGFCHNNASVLQINITISSSSLQLAPVPLWFRQLDIRANDGSKLVHTLYGQALLLSMCMLPDKDSQRNNYLYWMNMDQNYNPLPAWSPGTYTFYLPLIGTIFDSGRLFMQNLKGRINIDLWPQSPVISGSGSLTVNYINLLSETEYYPPEELKLHKDYYDRVPVKNNVLEPIQLFYGSVTLNNGSAYKIQMDVLDGKFTHAALLLCQSGSSNSNNGLATWCSLGNGGLVDVKDPGGRSLYGAGTPVAEEFVRDWLYSSYFRNDFAKRKNAYVLVFNKNPLAGYAGSADGYFETHQDKKYIEITPSSSAGTSCVQTITLSGQAASGSYQLSFMGAMTNSLAYNASAATIQAALNALTTFQSYNRTPLSCTVNQAVSAGTSITITFAATNGNVPDLVQLIPDNLETSAPAAITASSALTTQGIEGFTSTTYDIYCYFWQLRSILQVAGVIGVENV